MKTKKQRERTQWNWRLRLYPLIVIPLMIYFNAAPQPSIATLNSAPSQKGVGQGEVAVAAPIQGLTRDGRAWVRYSVKYPVVEFILILTNERR